MILVACGGCGRSTAVEDDDDECILMDPTYDDDEPVDGASQLTSVVAKPCRSPPSLFRATSSCGVSSSQQFSKKKKPKIEAEFLFLKLIGQGSFSKVMLVRKRHEPEKGRLFALKSAPRRNERSANVKSPFVVGVRYSFHCFIVTDYYEAGPFTKHVANMTEARAKFHGAELILALKHCHDFQVVHRDVKPSNVLMNRYGRIALADFGLCAFKVPLGATPLVTFVGTVAYMSPEILKGDAYGHAVDWWSFGVFLFEITHNGRTPFDGPTPRDLFQNIIKMEQPPFFLDSELSNVLSSSKGVQDQEKLRFTTALLLRKDPATRCGFGPKGALDVMASPFFYDVDWEHLHTLPSPYRRPHIDDDFRRVNLIDDQQTKHDLLARDFNLDTAKEAALANKTNVSVKKIHSRLLRTTTA
mmetsp:Transcript_35531/g.113538  ORF Transcript_35531/g.113538 Transcript_35531/m.113538 type:complete len:414 (+) Transcript_35531:1684-2925(+)